MATQSVPRLATDASAHSPRPEIKRPAEPRERAGGRELRRPNSGGWLDRLFRRSGSPVELPAAPDANALLVFGSEAAPALDPATSVAVVARAPQASMPNAQTWPKPSWQAVTAGILVAAAAIGAYELIRLRVLPLAATGLRSGKLTIETRPAGAEVTVDGVRRGLTPLALSVPPGAHTIGVRHGSEERVVPLSVSAGAELAHYFDLKTPDAPVVGGGRISVVTDPPGARVNVDGQSRGTSPATIVDLTPGEHRVAVTSETGSADRIVAVERGGTTSVVFSLPRVSAPLGGWLSVASPFDVEILEHDEAIGTNGTSRIMLASGRHDIAIVNRGLGYRETRRVEVAPGRITSIRVDAPKATLSANARPWAEVLIDGTSVGQTPLSNLMVTIGTHQVSFRHPQFGERRQSVVVTSKGPNRIAVDLTK